MDSSEPTKNFKTTDDTAVPSSKIDMHSLVNASHKLSAVTDIDQLLMVMMELIMKNAPANKAVILLKNNENWSVQVLDSILTKNNSLVKKVSDPNDLKADLIPEAILNYLLSSNEEIVIENAELDERFSEDNLIQTNKIKSIACIPIKSHGELMAMVYLENRKLESVFNLERMEFIKYLSSQFGISAENLLRYENLKKKISVLSESEIKLRLVFEQGQEAIIIAQDEKIKFCNPQTTELSGYSLDEIYAMNFTEFVHPDELEMVMNEYRKRLLGKKTKNRFSTRIITKDDQEKFVFISSSKVDWNGEPATRIMITDITQLKKAESELEKSEYHFRQLMEQSPLPMEILSPEGKINQVNSAWKKLWKVSDEEAAETLDKYNMLTDPQNEKLGIMDEVKKAFKGKQIILPPIQYDNGQTVEDFDLKLLKKFKAPWIQCHLNSVKDAKGEIAFIVNTYVDITDLKKAQETLVKSETRYRNLVEHSPLSVAVLTPEGKITEVNAAWKKLWGFNDKEAAQLMANYNYFDDKQIKDMGHAPLLERASKGETIIMPLIEYELKSTMEDLELGDIAQTSHIRWIKTHVYSIKNANEEIDSVVGINMDLTELKKAEKQTQRQRDELARIDRSSSMGQLTGSIAHELNQPLTGILSNAQAAEMILKSGNWNEEELIEILIDIIHDTKRGGDIIRNLKGLYQQQKGELKPYDLNEILGDTEKLLHSELVMNHVLLNTEIQSSIPIMNGNKVQIQQVLFNLIMNAAQALENKRHDDRKIEVIAVLDDSSLNVSVIDNGIGIDSDKIDHIFEPYATWKPGGTGMGLAISNSIIESHGGKMWAENKLDGGAIVGFSLPLIKPDINQNE